MHKQAKMKLELSHHINVSAAGSVKMKETTNHALRKSCIDENKQPSKQERDVQLVWYVSVAQWQTVPGTTGSMLNDQYLQFP